MRAVDPRLVPIVEPMLGVSLAPTRVFASDKINVIPAQARLRSTAACRPASARPRRWRDRGGRRPRRLPARVDRAGDRQPLADRLAARRLHPRLDRRARSGGDRRADVSCPVSPTRGPSATPSPSAPPTASSRTARDPLRHRPADPRRRRADRRRDLEFATPSSAISLRRCSAERATRRGAAWTQ
jgi:hypothetical protein